MSTGKKVLYILAIPLLLAIEFVFVLTSDYLLVRIAGSVAVFFTIFVDVMYLATRKQEMREREEGENK